MPQRDLIAHIQRNPLVIVPSLRRARREYDADRYVEELEGDGFAEEGELGLADGVEEGVQAGGVGGGGEGECVGRAGFAGGPDAHCVGGGVG